ncbi:MAG: histidine--tRNA ligase [Candidatus Sericytochromatia bacterium]|nr:histidine--tRNA ligase [Candidatus Tanganyikabacteria bacterium]
MGEPIAAPRGTADIGPPDGAVWHLVEDVARRNCSRHGFAEIRTPLFEATELFARGIGADTDIVGKEMYTFRDRSDRSLTLRPEGTAGVVRAFLEHKLYATAPSPLKLWYQGPMFRYERPQKGRQRQFYQIGVEVFGSAEPAADAEVVALAYQCYQDMAADLACRVADRLGAERAAGLHVPPDLRVELNSLGDQACRPRYREALQAYFRDRAAAYCADCARRMETNPLRVLDCKVPPCVALNAQAPALELCADCSAHFAAVKDLLAGAGVPFSVNPRIVRGLDYYTRTVFELVPADAPAAGQTTLCAGGRYDGLVAELGGPPTPAVGWALGEERAVQWLLDRAELSAAELARVGAPATDVFVAPLASEAVAAAFRLVQHLRRAGLAADMAFKAAKPDKHFKQAERAGARFIALLGPDELARQEIAVKDLATRTQINLPLDAEIIAAHARAPARAAQLT